MLEILSGSEEDVLGLRFTGKLTDEDYEEILAPAMEGLIEKHGKVKVLCYFDEGFEGWEMGAMWADTKFGVKHRKDFARLAVVGGPRWIEWGTKAFAPMMQGEVRTFPVDKLDEAWEWVRS
jgi:hypothetical protein